MDQDAKPLTDPDAAIAPAGAGISSSPRPLSVLRGLIDEIDARVVEALNDRAKIVMEVGLRKAAEGTPVYAPHREAAVLSKVLALNRGGPLLNVTLEAIYREIMSGSFALERSLRIGSSLHCIAIRSLDVMQGSAAARSTSHRYHAPHFLLQGTLARLAHSATKPH